MRSAFLALAVPLAVAPPGLVSHPGNAPAVSPLSIQIIAPLSFGGLLIRPPGGRITLTAGGSLVPQGQGVLPAGLPQAGYARFLLKGPANGHFQLAVQPNLAVLRGRTGSTVQLLSFDPCPPIFTGTFNASGQIEIDLGGTLDIPGGIPTGPYCIQANATLGCAGQSTVVQPFLISCTLRAPLTLANTGPLDFGGLMPGPMEGIYQVGGGGSAVGENGPRLLKGVPREASFLLTGPSSSVYSIILPAAAFLTGPAGTMQIRDFTCSQPKSGFLPNGGLIFQVGAGLVVPAAQPSGNYQGTFQVTVVYP